MHDDLSTARCVMFTLREYMGNMGHLRYILRLLLALAGCLTICVGVGTTPTVYMWNVHVTSRTRKPQKPDRMYMEMDVCIVIFTISVFDSRTHSTVYVYTLYRRCIERQRERKVLRFGDQTAPVPSPRGRAARDLRRKL